MFDRVAIGVGVLAYVVGLFVVSVGGGYMFVSLGLLSVSVYALGGWLTALVAVETGLVGFAAGVLAGIASTGRLAAGAWNGLLAGTFGGLLLTAGLAVVVSVLTVVLGGGFGSLEIPGSVSTPVAVGAVVTALAIDSGIGGAIGAAVTG